MKFLVDAWYARARWPMLLYPAGLLFAWLARRRRAAFLSGRRQIYRAPVPVIVVGNISVGGTGKTPLVIALARALRDAGYRPGIVSRGHGARARGFPLVVRADHEAREVGDEPLLLARSSGCPVVIDPDRPAAVRLLLSQFDCNVVLSDDGLQHYAMARDIEIAVIDGARGLGNGLPLPAGPLREPPSRLAQVDFVVSNGEPRGPGIPQGATVMGLEPRQLHNMVSEALRPLGDVAGRQVHAVAGIGNPERFFATLGQLGFAIIAHAFADHHDFTPEDLRFDDDLDIVMTEKDAVKCQPFASARCWVLKVEASLPQVFLDSLMERLGR